MKRLKKTTLGQDLRLENLSIDFEDVNIRFDGFAVD